MNASCSIHGIVWHQLRNPAKQTKFLLLTLFTISLFSFVAKSQDYDNSVSGSEPNQCEMKKLRFSADFIRPIPSAGSKLVWGGNATGGGHLVDPPYSSEFLSATQRAKQNNLQVFAYLEGPCGDTGGVDDGEIARCRSLHRDFNRRFAPGTPDTDLQRWKPFTITQMKMSGELGIDFCEIDNLENNVVVPFVPLFKEIKNLYDQGKIHCQLVLKNLPVSDINTIKEEVAPTPQDANFIAPFHIFEANNTSQKRSLDQAMIRLKGTGAATIISTNTNNYGSAFTDDEFLSCTK